MKCIDRKHNELWQPFLNRMPSLRVKGLPASRIPSERISLPPCSRRQSVCRSVCQSAWRQSVCLYSVSWSVCTASVCLSVRRQFVSLYSVSLSVCTASVCQSVRRQFVCLYGVSLSERRQSDQTNGPARGGGVRQRLTWPASPQTTFAAAPVTMQ